MEKKVNSKNKGKRGEREVAKLLKENGYNARRGQQYCGANGDADVIGVDGMHIEVKWVERLNLENAMKQAEEDARKREIPVVFHKRNNTEWCCTLRTKDFINMWKMLTDEQIYELTERRKNERLLCNSK